MKKRDWAFVAACLAGALLFGVWSIRLGVEFYRSQSLADGARQLAAAWGSGIARPLERPAPTSGRTSIGTSRDRSAGSGRFLQVPELEGPASCHAFECSAIHLTASPSVTKPLTTSVSPSGHKISIPQPVPGFFRAMNVGCCSSIGRVCACGGQVQANHAAITFVVPVRGQGATASAVSWRLFSCWGGRCPNSPPRVRKRNRGNRTSEPSRQPEPKRSETAS